ncbi:hypothetical protein PHMEG_00041142, partial [Phytophthora megakarya]
NFNNDPAGYRERISSTRERFAKYSVTSAVQHVHEASVNAKIPCAVPEGVHCPHCPVGAPRIGERDLTGYTTTRVPANIKELRAKLVCTRQHPSVVTEHNTPRNTAPRSVTPPVRGGLRTPSPFPERPSSGRFGETTSRRRADCLQRIRKLTGPRFVFGLVWSTIRSTFRWIVPRTKLCFCRRC